MQVMQDHAGFLKHISMWNIWVPKLPHPPTSWHKNSVKITGR